MPLGSYVTHCPHCDNVAPRDHITPCKHGGADHCLDCIDECSYRCKPGVFPKPLPRVADAVRFAVQLEEDIFGVRGLL